MQRGDSSTFFGVSATRSATTKVARAQTATATSPPLTKAHLSIRPTMTLTLIAMRTSPIGEHVCFVLLKPKPPSGGQTKKEVVFAFAGGGVLLFLATKDTPRTSMRAGHCFFLHLRGHNQLFSSIAAQKKITCPRGTSNERCI